LKVLLVTFFVVLADQITKLYVKGISIPFFGIDFAGMPYQSSIVVIDNFFKITFIENPGMAFGLQIGGKLFLSLFTIFATILLFYFLYKNRKESIALRLALAFILGGAVGNLIDRVFYGVIFDYAPIFHGRVVDFLHFDFPNFTLFGKTFYSWPIFNIADVFVTVGFLIILIGYRKIFKHEQVSYSENDLALDGINDGNEIKSGDANNESEDPKFAGNYIVESEETVIRSTEESVNFNDNTDSAADNDIDINTADNKQTPIC